MTTLSTPAVTTWNIDPVHSVAEFKVKLMMISNVKGQFTRLTGTLTLDEADITNSTVKASIEIDSINTRDEQRDGHLKGPDFFHAEQFPVMTLEATRVTRNGDGDLVVAGNLTIKDVTRHVEFLVEGPSAPAKDPWGNSRIGLSATTKINRKEFGLIWNAVLETGGALVGEDITITLDLQFIKA